MSEWKRATRACTLEQLTDGLGAAVRAHIETYGLQALPSRLVAAVRTDSEKPKSWFLGRAQRTSVWVAHSAEWLIFVSAAEGQPPGVMSARLRDVRLADYAGTASAKLIMDSGVEVTGRFTDTPTQGLAFIPLDEGPEGRGFFEGLMSAWRDVEQG